MSLDTLLVCIIVLSAVLFFVRRIYVNVHEDNVTAVVAAEKTASPNRVRSNSSARKEPL